jgi:ATP-dependent exoDNAse (exonuclease V) beta subunit
MKVEIVSASAGTGKTHRLCHDVVAALTAPPAERTRIEGLVAITYTRKAEAELRQRIRRELIARGLVQEAQRLPLAYCGTVHAVCLRLLTEYALFIGLPPVLEVLPDEDADYELARALERAMALADRTRFEDICSRVQPNADVRTGEYNWIVDAQDLIELARSNRIAPDKLPDMARRSAESLLALLPKPLREDDNTLDARLVHAIASAITAIEAHPDDTQKTATALKLLHEQKHRLDTGSLLTWANWLQLSKLEAAVAADPYVERVRRVANEHLQHPRFHSDLREYITTLYQLVARGLDDYGRWKQVRRLVDFVDMEERALHLLEREDVAKRLRDQLDLVVIDEFQDTSPIQLELFLRLQSLAKRSIWVGDRKQSIFAFRGADPMLMDSVIAAVKREGRAIDVLATNRRSRASLVEFASAAFSPTFSQQGITADEVRAEAHRGDTFLEELPPLACWWLPDTNQSEEVAAIAQGVSNLVATAERTLVIDPETGKPRPVRADDIAILAATNKETRRIADALESVGIATVVARGGLLQTPEGTVLRAALRLVVDREDHAAAAELDALDGYDGRSPDEWLGERIRAYAQDRSRPPSRGLARRIENIREGVAPLSPVEAVDRLVAALDLCTLCRRWPAPAQGLANLDAFAALARRYEEHCGHAREAASLWGFLSFLCMRAIDGADEQQPVSEGAVQVCTYHRAKGLEWPVVILASLDTKTRAFGVTPDAAAARLERGQQHRVFGAAPESDAATFDAVAPLAGRWLRLWPWPYPSHKNAELGDLAATTDEAKRVRMREAGESLRLLYVGFTRARDHLVLAARIDRRTGQPKTEWLKAINDGRDTILQLPVGERERQQVTLLGSARAFEARVWRLESDPDERHSANSVEQSRLDFAQGPRLTAAALPFRISPSNVQSDWPGLPARVADMYQVGGRTAFNVAADEYAEAGTAVHDFLAADRPSFPREQRIARAASLLSVRAISSMNAPDLVIAADALRANLDCRWPGAVWHYEVPVSAMLDTVQGRQRVDGRIDLLLETATGWVLVDHKAFPGRESAWAAHAIEHAPQLAAYRQVLLMSNTLPVLACLIHLPIAGGIVELTFDRR